MGIWGPVLTILTMPRCTVGTRGPPEEPPLCAEEAMCRDGKTARSRLGGVNVDVGAGERPLSEERAGGELQTRNGTDAPDARRSSNSSSSSSGTGIEKGDAISAAATRSTRRASVPERPRPPANEHPEPARPPANRHPAREAPPLCPKSGDELQEALKELICGDGLNLGRDFRGSLEGSVGRCSETERTRQHLAAGRGRPWEPQG